MTEKLQNLNTINLYYESNGSGETIVLLHGLGSSTRDWEKQVEFFKNNFKVITCDLRGHGRSRKPAGPYSVALFAADVAELITTLDCQAVHLVGISMGGMIALQAAIDYPALVKTLTVVNAVPEVILRTVSAKFKYWQRLFICRLLGMRATGKFLARRLFPGPRHERLRRQFIERWAANNKQAYLASLSAIISWSTVELLHTIHCPTLIMAADNDYTSLATKRDFAAKIPGAQFAVIHDSRHASPIEQPDQFNKVLAEFLEQNSPQKPVRKDLDISANVNIRAKRARLWLPLEGASGYRAS